MRRHEVNHGCCWLEWYDTSMWDVVPIKVTEDPSSFLPLTFPMHLLLINYWREFWTICLWKQIICGFLSFSFSKKKKKRQQIYWKCAPVSFENSRGIKLRICFSKTFWRWHLQLRGDDVDNHNEERGDWVKCIFVHSCNMLSYKRLGKSQTLSCQEFLRLCPWFLKFKRNTAERKVMDE